MKIQSIKDINKKVTGNWFIRNNLMYIEIRKVSRAAYGIPFTSYKYISENKIFKMIGDNE